MTIHKQLIQEIIQLLQKTPETDEYIGIMFSLHHIITTTDKITHENCLTYNLQIMEMTLQTYKIGPQFNYAFSFIKEFVLNHNMLQHQYSEIVASLKIANELTDGLQKKAVETNEEILQLKKDIIEANELIKKLDVTAVDLRNFIAKQKETIETQNIKIRKLEKMARSLEGYRHYIRNYISDY